MEDKKSTPEELKAAWAKDVDELAEKVAAAMNLAPYGPKTQPYGGFCFGGSCFKKGLQGNPGQWIRTVSQRLETVPRPAGHPLVYAVDNNVVRLMTERCIDVQATR